MQCIHFHDRTTPEDTCDECDFMDETGLYNGQFFGRNVFKNLHWYLNGEHVGYGDLTAENIENIRDHLTGCDWFTGLWESWNFNKPIGTTFPDATERDIAIQITEGEIKSTQYSRRLKEQVQL